MKVTKSFLHIGTCSWKYDSWRGIVYSDSKEKNFLREYSQHFSTVEVDQWFWSLFTGDKVVLPKPKVVQEYADSVPEDFIFSIKVPNSITLTHHYKKQKSDSLIVNPHFLSVGAMKRFLELLEPLSGLAASAFFMTIWSLCLTRIVAFFEIPRNRRSFNEEIHSFDWLTS